jgi:HK97 family phage major capsid protein
MEVKADALEQSFESVSYEENSISLREELDLLKSRLASGRLAQRPALEGIKSADTTAFVDRFLRRGMDADLEAKSADNASGSTGGFAIPRDIDERIDRTLVALSPIRAIANVVKVGTSNYRKLITNGGAPSGWVGYEASRPETSTPTFTEVVPASGELYANPAASQHMLDDAMFDVETWLANEIATEFARAEGAAFIKGTGVNQPLGFLNSPNAVTADAARPMGTLQTIATGVAGAFPTSNPADKLIDLVQSLRQPYRQGAVFVMNSATAATIRKFKTVDGAFIWQPGLAAGQPSTLLGYPVVEAEDMPDVSANSLSVAFGNFKAGYIIAERSETSILRDPYTKKPYVYFYATQALENRVHPVVEGAPTDAPPVKPTIGQQFLVGEAPLGEFAEQPGALATWTEAGWLFTSPYDRFSVVDRLSGLSWTFEGEAWRCGLVRAKEVLVDGKQVLGSRQSAIAAPSGGSMIDKEARATIEALLSVMRQHGLIST